jgi:hypothetical protein
MRDQWHKIVIMLMRRYGCEEVEMTFDDIKSLQGTHVVADTSGGGLTIKLVDEKTARALAAQEGGLPR